MMSSQTMDYVLARTLFVGDRVRIRQDRWPLLGRRDQTGTVVEILRMPRDSCLVRIDGDPKYDRKWFFYRVEVTISNV